MGGAGEGAARGVADPGGGGAGPQLEAGVDGAGGYDWKNGDSVIIKLEEDQLEILDDWTLQLKDAGMAHSFVMKSKLSLHYEGRIESGEVVEIHLSNPIFHECH